MSDKAIKIEFLVKAKTWQEVVDIFKSELNINKEKQNINDRNINGLFIVQVGIEEDDLTEDFFKKVRKSVDIAIVASPLDERRRNGILAEVYKVETQLRKLLLNVSDLVENFFDHFKKPYIKDFAQKKETIIRKNLNPVTSQLTFDDIMAILKYDISWENKPITGKELAEVFSEKDAHKYLLSKISPATIWDKIAENVLNKHVSWNTLENKLMQLKELRNQAAHFNILTEADLNKARELSKDILAKIKTKRNITLTDIDKLQKSLSAYSSTFSSFADALSDSLKNYQDQISRLADIAAVTQSEQLVQALNFYKNFHFDTEPTDSIKIEGKK